MPVFACLPPLHSLSSLADWVKFSARSSCRSLKLVSQVSMLFYSVPANLHLGSLELHSGMPEEAQTNFLSTNNFVTKGPSTPFKAFSAHLLVCCHLSKDT